MTTRRSSISTPETQRGEAATRSARVPLGSLAVPARLKMAMKGTREQRAVLIRDPNKIVSAAVLSSPKLSDTEVESFARMTNVSEEVLRVIGTSRGWVRKQAVAVALVKNPKTPPAISLSLLPRMATREVKMLTMDRNVPEALRLAARKAGRRRKHGSSRSESSVFSVEPSALSSTLTAYSLTPRRAQALSVSAACRVGLRPIPLAFRRGLPCRRAALAARLLIGQLLQQFDGAGEVRLDRLLRRLRSRGVRSPRGWQRWLAQAHEMIPRSCDGSARHRRAQAGAAKGRALLSVF